MSNSVNFLIRDGLESDIDPCSNLDGSYETDFVWQMTRQEQTGFGLNVAFRKERLPRSMEVVYNASILRIRHTLATENCFLVALANGTDMLGYLTMQKNSTYNIGLIQDIVVEREARRHRIGTRLIRVARQWALEHKIDQLTIEVSTKNYPGITFCQKMGFSFCGFNDQYFPNQDIAVFFGLALR